MKAHCPISVTLFGMDTEVRDSQSLKAPSPMCVTPSGMVTTFTDFRSPLKKYSFSFNFIIYTPKILFVGRKATI